MHNPPTVTVFTAAFNRRNKLARLYQSLLGQTYKDFEWVVVDDGSSDGTADYLAALEQEGKLSVWFAVQENRGKHVAFNRGVDEAKGRLFVNVDSDDWLLPDGLEKLVKAWNSIPEEDRREFAAVAGLCETPSGELIGDPFPEGRFDSNFVDIRVVHRVRGDKTHILVTDVLQNYPYPVFPGEKFIAEGFVWNQLALAGKTRFINERIQVRDYQGDGLTAKIDLVRAKSPVGARAYYKELVNEHWLPMDLAVKNCANYVRYSVHAGIGVAEQYQGIKRRMAYMLGLPLGLLVYLRDRRLLERSVT